MASHDSALFDRMVDIVLPAGGCVVAIAEVYIDESGSHEGSPVLCLAGYVFRKREARLFTADWSRVLRREGLPYFRMSAAAGGGEPFTGPSDMPRRVRAEMALIERIHRYSPFGFGVAVDERRYNEMFREKERMGGAYTFCLRSCLSAVRHWADGAGFSGKIVYVFEAGHSQASEANRIMTRIFKTPKFNALYRYGGHIFADKKDAAPLQTGDLLSWQLRKDKILAREGKKSRKDFVRLIRPADRVIDYTGLNLEAFGYALRDRGLVEEAWPEPL